jgi:hypothetical protein
MSTTHPSAQDEIVSLKAELALARSRLERADSFVFDLRCLAAKKRGRVLWVRERDKSGLREAYGETDGLGDWTLLAVSHTHPASLPLTALSDPGSRLAH